MIFYVSAHTVFLEGKNEKREALHMPQQKVCQDVSSAKKTVILVSKYVLFTFFILVNVLGKRTFLYLCKKFCH